MALFRDKYRIETTRYRNWDYRTPGWYFVTICTKGHACVFGEIVNNRMTLSLPGQIAHEELCNLPQHYADIPLDHFVVMPNHVHLIVGIGGSHVYSVSPPAQIKPATARNQMLVPPQTGSLSAIIRSYKAGVTRRCRQMSGDFDWQAGFHEHIVRTTISLNAIREYIENNPANWAQDDQNPNS